MSYPSSLFTRSMFQAAVSQYVRGFVEAGSPGAVSMPTGELSSFYREGWDDCLSRTFSEMRNRQSFFVCPPAATMEEEVREEASSLLSALRGAIEATDRADPNGRTALDPRRPGEWTQKFARAIGEAGENWWNNVQKTRVESMAKREARVRADAFQAELEKRGLAGLDLASIDSLIEKKIRAVVAGSPQPGSLGIERDESGAVRLPKPVHEPR